MNKLQFAYIYDHTCSIMFIRSFLMCVLSVLCFHRFNGKFKALDLSGCLEVGRNSLSDTPLSNRHVELKQMLG